MVSARPPPTAASRASAYAFASGECLERRPDRVASSFSLHPVGPSRSMHALGQSPHRTTPDLGSTVWGRLPQTATGTRRLEPEAGVVPAPKKMGCLHQTAPVAACKFAGFERRGIRTAPE
jgi:hypothetical protein